jgi:long-chain acyl-CoA synthetase
MAIDMRHWPSVAADRSAIIMAGTNEVVTYGQFGFGVNRVSRLLLTRGLGRGDTIVVLAKNEPTFLQICFGARFAGIDFTPVSKFLMPDEVAYIVQSGAAKAIFVSQEFVSVLEALGDCPDLRHRFVIGGNRPGFEKFEEAIGAVPDDPVEADVIGHEVLFSSGSTGRPKGIRFLADVSASIPASIARLTESYGFDEHMVNLTPAPLYHAAPLRYSLRVADAGGTNVIMEQFDAEHMLRTIDRYRVSHIEAVPTMLVRLLKLPTEVRERYDLSSLRFLVHSGGPCAPEVKRAIIEWLGPIIHENYGGTEANGLCALNSVEWLAHPGSVGKAVVGKVHILSEDCLELPIGETGVVYFEGGSRFQYLNDPQGTAMAYTRDGWSTLGDIGHLDSDGYLYLTDRRSSMVISGGVNLYPQEAENILIAHPEVIDAAVFGVPDPEYGEAIVAIVQPQDMRTAGKGLENDLIAFCKSRIASLKCPRQIRFSSHLPRDENGKLFKSKLPGIFQAMT